MTLSFSQQINGKPNYFIEKIWSSLGQDNQAYKSAFVTASWHYLNKCWDHIEGKTFPPKLHTIRRDEHNRWKEGMTIHPVINNRTPERFQFAPEFKCTGIQEIEIMVRPEIKVYSIMVDGKPISGEKVLNLAINDGFEDLDGFLRYFAPDFKGKLIHWTNLRY